MNAGMNAGMKTGASAGRWLALAGLIFVLAWVVGLAVALNGPGPTASNDAVGNYFITHQQAQLVQTYLIDGIAGAALLVFAAALHAVMRQLGDDHATLANVVFGSGVAAASVSFVQAGIGEALANPDILKGAGFSGIRMFFVLLNDADTFKMLALAMLTGAAAIVILQTRVMPVWLGWLGVLVAVLLIVGGLSFVLNSATIYPVLYAALPLLLIWVALVGVVAWTGARVPAARAPQGMAR